jgi:hypothetical protein
MGKEVEILAGLNGAESLVASPVICSARVNMLSLGKSQSPILDAGYAFLIGLLALVIGGCKVGPNYKRPDVETGN